MKTELKTVVIKTKRRNPKLAEKAKELLKKLMVYDLEKEMTKNYDLSGKILDNLNQEILSCIQKYKLSKIDSLEDIEKKINDLLYEIIPSYENLHKAYNLAKGRGMDSNFVNQALIAMPDDDETKVSIAEKIEEYVSKLQ